MGPKGYSSAMAKQACSLASGLHEGCIGGCMGVWGVTRGASRSQSALYMHVLVCICSNVRQFHEIIGMIQMCYQGVQGGGGGAAREVQGEVAWCVHRVCIGEGRRLPIRLPIP